MRCPGKSPPVGCAANDARGIGYAVNCLKFLCLRIQGGGGEFFVIFHPDIAGAWAQRAILMDEAGHMVSANKDC